ncbi:MAG TPA: hypothetical protein VKX96_11645, partial [Chloroflexota bacterium]|nr:hypothetical protein [Chloroflexota bacterium]
AALCIGVAFLTRPIGLFLPIIVGPAIWWLRRTSARRASLLAAGAFILVGMLFPAGWTARNYFVAGLAQPTSLIAINGYYYRAAPLQARTQGISVNDEQSALSTAPGIQASRTGEENSAELRTMEQRAIQIILSNPVSYAEINALGTARMLGPDRDILARLSAAERMSTTPPSSVAEFITTTTRHGPETTGVVLGVEVAQLVALYSLAVIGILIGWHDESRRAPIALLVMLIFYFLVISGPEAYPRFRVPMMPFVCILAALGAQACGRYLAARSILAETDPGARREQA